jgi:small subunit ribosomal protein S9
MSDTKIYWGVGRRKNSVARVRLLIGKGDIFVNTKSLKDYFKGLDTMVEDVLKPLALTKTTAKYSVRVNVKGGGISGQAGAIRHGIARALAAIDDSNRILLRKEGYLTRDSRMVERKKPGQPKARKHFQFSKR